MVTALSTIGFASRLAPHVDVGVSALKNLYKFMGKELRAGLKLVIDEAKSTGKLEKLSGLAGSMGKTWNAIGMGTLDLVRLSGDMEVLGKLTKAVDLYGRPAFGMMMTGGKKAVGFLEMAVDGGFRLVGEPGRRMIRFAVRYPMMGARILKIARKVGWDNLDVTLVGLAELLVMVDSRVLIGLGLLLWTWCFWLEALNVLFHSLFRPTGEAPGH